MPASTAGIVRFVRRYKGIEGFYFLNDKGELGYITADAGHAAKEVFSRSEDKDFIRAYPRFGEQIGPFVEEIRRLPACYLEDPDAEGLELGYVEPAGIGRSWSSATLVLNREIVEELEADDKTLYAAGLKDPFQIDAAVEKVQGVRSVQQGLDDLIHHQDVFGTYKFFPVLFKVPWDQRGEKDSVRQPEPLRVLNLKWRASSESAFSTAQASPFETVFTVLRAYLIEHGAIAREKRLQNKFVIA